MERSRPTEQEAQSTVYWQGLDGDPYRHPAMAVQLRVSLMRQRRAHVDFDVAWRRAVGHIAHDHDHEDRSEDFAILAEPSYRELWRCAYLRKPCPPVEAMSLLAQALTPDDLPGAHDPRREARRYAA